MNIFVKIHVLDKEKKSGTTKKFAENLLKKTFQDKKQIDNFSIMTILDDSGGILQEIEIDLHGILPVIGGISFHNSKGKEYNLIVADYHGACLMLYELVDDKAYFHGALSGVELDRYSRTQSGGSFKYYNRIYKKLSAKEISAPIKRDKYVYSTCEKIESARKSGKDILCL